MLWAQKSSETTAVKRIPLVETILEAQWGNILLVGQAMFVMYTGTTDMKVFHLILCLLCCYPQWTRLKTSCLLALRGVK